MKRLKSNHKPAPQTEAEKSAKTEALQSAKIAAYVASLSKAGRFVRFTFIREIKQNAGIDDARAFAEFEKAVKGGKVREAGTNAAGDVKIYSA